MIAHLRGTVLFKFNNVAVIDINGVGYEVIAPTSVLHEWKLNEEISAHICTVVREDAFQLFGFASAAQKTTFETLRGVNKIGAKLALTILSHLDVNQLATAIQTKNAAMLSSVPGIGKKTAERMCLELKDKIVGEMVIPQAKGKPPLDTSLKKRILFNLHLHSWITESRKLIWLSILILFLTWSLHHYKSD